MNNKIIIVLVLISCNIYSQVYDSYDIAFENPEFTSRIKFDSTGGNCIWQIGSPQKSFFSSAYSEPNAIITDTVNPYPINDTSAFYIKHLSGTGYDARQGVTIAGYYKVDCDSLNDFGTIKFSPDNGVFWYDLLSDTINGFVAHASNAVFTGKANWTWFYIDISSVGDFLEIGDTVIYMFVFISDGIQNNRDGLMFDNLRFLDFRMNIEQDNIKSFSSTIYPNPGKDHFVIEFENLQRSCHTLYVYNLSGELILLKPDIHSDQVEINLANCIHGIYCYILYNEEVGKVSTGKIILK